MINDIFKSFFKTLGKILAYLFVGVLIALFLGRCEVNAALVSTPTIMFDGTTYSYDPNAYYIPSVNTDSFQFNIGHTSGTYKVDISALFKVQVGKVYNNEINNSSFGASLVLGDDIKTMSKACNILEKDLYFASISCTFSVTTFNASSSYTYLKVWVDKGMFGYSYLDEVSNVKFGVRVFITPVQDSNTNDVVSGGNQDIINNQNGTSQDIINNNNQNKNDIINNQEQNKNDIINNQDKNTDKITDSMKDFFENSNSQNEKNTQDIIDNQNKNFQTCRDSYNLIDISNNKTIKGYVRYNINLKSGIDYTLKFSSVETDSSTDVFIIGFFNSSDVFLHKYVFYDKKSLVFNLSQDATSITIYSSNSWVNSQNVTTTFKNFMIYEGTDDKEYEAFGEQICKNKIDETNDKLDKVNETNKGILETIKSVFTEIVNLPSKIVNLFIDGLKMLFIPSDDFFTNKFNELTENVESKMGVLAYPLTITIETFEFLLTVEDTGSYVIRWPDVVVPNFDFVIIPSGSFDLAIILENGWVDMAHNLYMVFVSTYLLLSFFKFCNNKYSDMFGGDYDNTDYVIVEDSIVDVHENEDGSKYYVNHKERRYNVGDE